jgi:hypothetical protein
MQALPSSFGYEHLPVNYQSKTRSWEMPCDSVSAIAEYYPTSRQRLCHILNFSMLEPHPNPSALLLPSTSSQTESIAKHDSFVKTS